MVCWSYHPWWSYNNFSDGSKIKRGIVPSTNPAHRSSDTNIFYWTSYTHDWNQKSTYFLYWKAEKLDLSAPVTLTGIPMGHCAIGSQSKGQQDLYRIRWLSTRLCWVPGFSSLEVNRKADDMAKQISITYVWGKDDRVVYIWSSIRILSQIAKSNNKYNRLVTKFQNFCVRQWTAGQPSDCLSLIEERFAA